MGSPIVDLEVWRIRGVARFEVQGLMGPTAPESSAGGQLDPHQNQRLGQSADPGEGWNVRSLE